MNSVQYAIRAMVRNYHALPATVHVLCFGAFLNRVGSFVMLFLTIYVTEHLGADKRFATWCVSAFGIGSVISSLIGGQLADQFGRRRTLLLALFGGAATLVLLSTLRSPLAFMAVLFLFALVMEMYRPASAAMLGDVTTTEQRPHAYGLMFMAINLGFSVAPPVGGTLAEYSFQWLFWADAASTAVYGLVVLLLIRESIPRRVAGTSDPGLAAALRHVAGNRTFLLFCGGHLLTLIVFMQAFTTLPLYVRSMGFNTRQFGWMICINGILIVLLQMPLTFALRRFNRARILLIGELFLAAGFGLTAFAGTAPLLIGTIVLWTMGEILQAPYKQTIVSELAPAELRGRYMGIFNLAFALSLMIAPILGGEVLTRFGPHVLWPGCFLTLLITTALYVRLYRPLSSPGFRDSDSGLPAGKCVAAAVPSVDEFDTVSGVPELSRCESAAT